MDFGKFWGGGGAAPYEIEQSLRFANGGNYLTRTPSSAGSRTTWTYSAWVKYTIKSANHAVLLSAGSAGSNYDNIRITTTGHTPPTALSWYANNANYSRTSAKIRDPSAWYHFVFVWDTTNGTAADRRRMYINGVRQTDFYDNSNPGSSTQSYVNNNWLHAIGALTYNVSTTSEAMDGYMAEVHFVDGTAKNPTDFGEFDDNGAWRPIAYSGSYGTNGYYLKFDPSATNGIGHDHSGNGNHWTPSGFSTSTTTYNINNDVVKDTPTNNHATWLPGKSNSFLPGQAQAYADYRNNGNLYGNTGRNSPNSMFASIPFPDNAKTYVEVYINDVSGGGGALAPGVAIGCDYNGFGPYIYGSGNYNQDTAAYFSGYDGAFSWNGGSGTSNGGGFGAGTLIGVAVDTTTTSPTITFYKNGTQAGSGTVGSAYRKNLVVRVEGSTGSSTAVGAYINSGQYDFDNLPSGYSALCTNSYPAPDIADGSKHFNTVLYTGNGSTNNITGVGFQPNIVWIKDRNNSAYVHQIFDSVRGTSAALVPSEGTAEANYNSFTSFDSDGFTVPNALGTNTNNTPIAAWAWKEGAVPGLDIVTYTGNGWPGSGTQNISHNLGVAPGLIILKDRDTTSNWVVGHQSLGWTKGMEGLDDGDGVYTNADFWNNTAPTSSVFTVGTNSGTNYQNHRFVAYCFAEVEGYSKFGSYVGNGSSDGPFVFCGFKPELVVLKRTVSNTSWHMLDITRNTYNPANKTIRADANTQEQTDTAYHVDLLSNGFKLRASYVDTNSSGYTFIYFAFASHPFGGDGVSPATAR